MELTGKAKEALQAYFKGSDDFYNTSVEEFQNYPESMQYGVLVDFFKSVNIYIYIEVYLGGGAPVEFPKIVWRNKDWIDCYWEVLLDDGTHYPFDAETNEARTAAIKKAVEIFNNRI